MSYRALVNIARAAALWALVMCLSAQAQVGLPPVVAETQYIESGDPNYVLNGPIALSGETLLAGSIHYEGWDPILETVFTVFVFQRDAATGQWAPDGILTRFALDGGWPHAFYVAVDGSSAVVTTYGHVEVFERTQGVWARSALDVIPGEYEYGSGAAVSGEHMLLGGESGGRLAGLMYKKSAAGHWSFHQALFGAGDPAQGFFGARVDLSDSMAIIGGRGTVVPGAWPGAHVYVRGADGSWVPDTFFDLEEPFAVADRFLASRVSSPSHLGPWLMERQGPGTWSYAGALEMLHAWSSLDMTVGPSGEVLAAVGAPESNYLAPQSGAAYVFEYSTNPYPGFKAKALLLPTTRAGGIGSGVAIDGHRVAVHSSNAWTIYIYDIPADLAPNPPLLQDDFEDGNASGWRRTASSWSVAPNSGSSVFRQTALTGDRRALFESIDWTNQAIETDVTIQAFDSSAPSRWVGVVTRYADDRNNYYAVLRSTNRVEIYKRVNGTVSLLAWNVQPVQTQRTYRMRFEAIGTRLRVLLDGVLAVQANDADLPHGAVGLRTYSARAQFDNVIISPSPAATITEDSFEFPDRNPWTLQPPENWSIVEEDNRRFLRQNVALGGVRAIAGTDYEIRPYVRGVADHIVQARVRPISFIPNADPWVGLIARYKDDANYIYITFNRNGYISLRKLVDGVIHVFDTAPITLRTGSWYTLRLEAVGRHLRAYVDGKLMLEGIDNPVPEIGYARSKYGLMTSRASADFDDFKAIHP